MDMTDEKVAETLEEELTRLRAENTAFKEVKVLDIRFGQKNNVCIYQLGQRFPVTLYAPGWWKLRQNIQELEDFLRDNHAELDWGKGEDPFA